MSNNIQIEKQLSNSFANLKLTSKNAFGAAANASKSSPDLWQSSGAKTIKEKMSDDLRDYANHAKGWHGLCTRCEKFPDKATLQATGLDAKSEIVFVTPLERIIYHADWCRLCAYLLRNIGNRENDPFQHSQIADFLQPHLQGKTFRQWIDLGPRSRYTDAHWPFGYGKELKEGAFYFLDPVTLKLRAKRQAALATSALIPMMMKVAMSLNNSSSSNNNTAPESTELVNLMPQDEDGDAAERVKETPPEDLIYPLECYLKITIHTNRDTLRSGRIHATLLGHGRGPGAQLATISQFHLRIENEPYLGNSENPLRYGALLSSRQINLSLAAKWLHECDNNHEPHCNTSSWAGVVRPPPLLRVIDVKNNCIVKAPIGKEFRFVALSYVWGKPSIETLMLSRFNIEQLSQRGGLREFWHGVSTTIKDAIEVVKGVGERYLWVDALCIIQDQDIADDESLRYIQEERTQQISAMDWLYSTAIFTIVAADSESSMMGIAGVREHTRSLKQDSVLVGKGIRLLTPVEVPEDLEESIWETRAWTLQEKLLSRRLLVFQDGHMVWHCRKATAHEDMVPEDKGIDYEPLSWPTFRKQVLGPEGKADGSITVFPDGTTRIMRSETFSQYASIIEQYTAREMSNDEDILDALGGMLHVFRQLFKFPVRYGLPEILLDVALLWRPAVKLERRRTDKKSTFPSWSWAGWKGMVSYEEPFLAKTDELLGTLRRLPLPLKNALPEERIRPLVRWHVKNKSNNELSPLNKSGFGIPLFAKGASFPEEWERVPPSKTSENDPPTSLRISDLSPDMVAHLAPCHLVFSTSCTSSLALGHPTPQAIDSSINPSDPPLRHAILFHHQQVGTLLLDGEASPKLDNRYEFIVICEAQYYGLDFEKSRIEGFPLFVVMLVVWNRSRTAAKRVGMGRIGKEAWGRCEARMKIVCLE